MRRCDYRNLVLVAIVAAFCFGGTFVCTSHHSDDDGSQSGGFVVINP